MVKMIEKERSAKSNYHSYKTEYILLCFNTNSVKNVNNPLTFLVVKLFSFFYLQLISRMCSSVEN